MKILKIFLIISFSLVLASEKVAITVKTIGEVSRSSEGQEGFNALKRGNALSDNDVIRTGENGFIVAMYLDDKTTVKITENSEFKISGERQGGSIQKRVAISYGNMHASVTKQKGGEFIISTPTSVASVKGTDIVIVCDPIQGDLFVTLIGVIEVKNNTTGETTTVSKGESATSTPDGSLEVHVTTEEETEEFEEDEETDNGSDEHKINFEIEDQDGGTHEVIIKYD